MAYIYKITNNINQKVYIGKTYLSVEKRWKEHCRDSRKERCEKRPLYSAMNKYGIENFSIETIEETNEPEEREKYWIEYYGSFKYGYNATTGGDGKPYVDKDLIFSLWNQQYRMKDISQITGYDMCTIRKYLKEISSIDERRSRGQQEAIKPVAQLDKNTGEILAVFSSGGAAGKSINKPSTHILAVCNGKRKTAYGYKWKFI